MSKKNIAKSNKKTKKPGTTKNVKPGEIKKTNKKAKAGEFRNYYHKKTKKGIDHHPALITKRRKKAKDNKVIDYISFTHSEEIKLNNKKLLNKKLNQKLDSTDPKDQYVVPIIQKAKAKKFGTKTLPYKITDKKDKSLIRNIKKGKRKR